MYARYLHSQEACVKPADTPRIACCLASTDAGQRSAAARGRPASPGPAGSTRAHRARTISLCARCVAAERARPAAPSRAFGARSACACGPARVPAAHSRKRRRSHACSTSRTARGNFTTVAFAGRIRKACTEKAIYNTSRPRRQDVPRRRDGTQQEASPDGDASIVRISTQGGDREDTGIANVSADTPNVAREVKREDSIEPARTHLEVPSRVVQRAHLPGFQPAADTYGCQKKRRKTAQTTSAVGSGARGGEAARAEPGRHDRRVRRTMEVKRVVAYAPRNIAVIRRRGLIRLALDARVHDMVPADRAVVDDHVWRVPRSTRREIKRKREGEREVEKKSA